MCQQASSPQSCNSIHLLRTRGELVQAARGPPPPYPLSRQCVQQIEQDGEPRGRVGATGHFEALCMRLLACAQAPRAPRVSVDPGPRNRLKHVMTPAHAPSRAQGCGASSIKSGASSPSMAKDPEDYQLDPIHFKKVAVRRRSAARHSAPALM